MQLLCEPGKSMAPLGSSWSYLLWILILHIFMVFSTVANPVAIWDCFPNEEMAMLSLCLPILAFSSWCVCMCVRSVDWLDPGNAEYIFIHSFIYWTNLCGSPTQTWRLPVVCSIKNHQQQNLSNPYFPWQWKKQPYKPLDQFRISLFLQNCSIRKGYSLPVAPHGWTSNILNLNPFQMETLCILELGSLPI